MAGKENREIKNSVFVDLFYEDESAEANEIALFNATHDEPLPEGTKIRKFRVDNTIYMNFQNDISFDAGGKVIVFGEHPSTVNENMLLRVCYTSGVHMKDLCRLEAFIRRKSFPFRHRNFTHSITEKKNGKRKKNCACQMPIS